MISGSTLRILAGVFTISAVGLLAVGCLDSRATPPMSPKTVPVAVTTLEPLNGYSRDTLFSGRVEAARDSVLGFELSGRVNRVLLDEGDRVEAGAVVAELDTARLFARRSEVAAGLAQIQAVRDLAEKTHQRVAEAASLNAVSELELDRAADELRARDAELARLKAQLEIIDVDLEKSRLRAPFAGEIVARMVDEGEVVPAGGPVLQLLERDNLEVRIGLSPEVAAGLEKDSTFELEVAGTTREARFKTLLARREARTRTVTALFVLSESQARHGDLAHLKIRNPVPFDGFRLPRTALTESVRGLWSCYVAEPQTDGSDAWRISRREVLVQHDEGEFVYVTGPLKPGDRVVRSGAQKLVPGMLVTPESGVVQ